MPLRAYRWFRRWFLGTSMWTCDATIGAIITAAATFAIWKWVPSPFATLIDHDGTAIYAAILSTVGALLGFAIAIVTIVQGLVSAPLFITLRRSTRYSAFWLAFAWSIRSLGYSVVVSLVAMFVGHIPVIWPYVCIVVAAVSVTAIVALGRAIRTLEVLLHTYRERQTEIDNATTEKVTTFPSVPLTED